MSNGDSGKAATGWTVAGDTVAFLGSAGIIIGFCTFLEGFFILCFYSLRIPLGLTSLLSITGFFGVAGIGAPYTLGAFATVCLAYLLAEGSRRLNRSSQKKRALVSRGASIGAVVLILGALVTAEMSTGSLVRRWLGVWSLVGWLIVAPAFLLIVPRVLMWRRLQKDRGRAAAVLILCCFACILGFAVGAQTLIGPRNVTVMTADGTATQQVLFERGDNGLWVQGLHSYQVRYILPSSVTAIDYK